MTNPLVLYLGRRDRLSDEEKEVVEGLVGHIRDFAAGEEFIHQGAHPKESVLILDGLAARVQLLKSGKRQFTALHIPGDFVDLHSLLLKVMDHGVVAISPVRVAAVPHDKLRRVSETHPHLTRLLWMSTVIDAAIHRAWLAAMGRRSTAGQIAHLVCELYVRMGVVDLTQDHSFSLPITQADLGDVLGKSTVHVNRALQVLRRDGLVTWKDRQVTILDWDRLVRAADFDPTYLSLQNEPR